MCITMVTMYEPIELVNQEEDVENDENSRKELYTIDGVLAGFGGVGRFQARIYLIACLISLVAGWRILFDLFAVKYCPWKCTELGLSMNCTDSELAGILPCDVPGNAGLDQAGDAEGKYWQYDANQSRNSIVSTFGLPCSERWKFSFTSSIYFIGSMLGVWIFGHISDHIGRYKTLIIGLVLCVIQAWIIPFTTDINIYLCCRFIDGASFGAYIMAMYVLAMEYSPPSNRAKVATLIQFFYSVGVAVISAYGYFLRLWDDYSIALAIPPTISLIICLFFIPESPRWLLGEGKAKEALALLQAVADINGCKMPKNVQLYHNAGVASGFKDAVKNWKLMRSTLIIMFGWFMTSLIYYMLWFGAKYLSGDIYLNAFLLGLAEIPGRVGVYFFVEKLGRKKTIIFAMIVAIAVMLGSIYEHSLSRTIMYCIGKTVTGGLLAVLYLYTLEMYPTKWRSLGSGVGNSAGRIAAFLAPFVGEVSKLGTAVPYVIVAVLASACISVLWMLPETKGKDLPQTLEEFDDLFDKKTRITKEDDDSANAKS